MMRTRAFVAVAVCVLVIGLGGSAAFAGEVTGTGEPTAGPEHANSICVFSGQNDDPDTREASTLPSRRMAPAALRSRTGRT
jgi:hypothetical protein